MAQRPHVPEFGNWEEDEVPYTVYFEKARKGRSGGKVRNPNDPQESTEVFSDDAPPVRASPLRPGMEPEAVVGPEAFRPKHERRFSREDGDFRRSSDSPAHHETIGQKGVGSGETPKRAARQSVGSDQSVEQSPLHQHYQAKVGGKGGGVSSPSWERKGSSEGSHGYGSSTPGRSRLRPAARGDETPDKGAAVPKFGEWDESNPASADEYSQVFNNLRKERQSGSAKVPINPTEASYFNDQRQKHNGNSKKCGCFPWGKK